LLTLRPQSCSCTLRAVKAADYARITGIVLAAAGLRFLLDVELGDKALLLVFPAAVAASAWVAGYSGGLFATGLSLAIGVAMFGGEGSFLSSLRAPGEIARAWLFIGQGVLISSLTGALRESRHDLERLVVSEREARGAAELAMRQRDHLLAIASHELRTPLNVILGWSSHLHRRDLPPQQQRKAIEIIHRNAQAEATIVEDLLDAAATFAGVVTIDRAPVDLVQLVHDVVEAVQPAAKDKGVMFAVDTERLPRYLIGDSRRLRQAIQKVAENAVKFTPAGGAVRVRSRTVGQALEVTVEDTGVGITADFMSRVFDRFTQQDQTPTRTHGGLGLGLAIARDVVERHGGRIDVTSAGPGRGASFTMTFPIVLRAITEAPHPVQLRSVS